MKYLKNFEDVKSVDDITIHGAVFGKNTQDVEKIKLLITYRNLNPIVLDIWNYAKQEFNEYPDKIVAFGGEQKCAIRYGGQNNTIVEIEVEKDIVNLWHFKLHYIPSLHDFDNKLIKAKKFTYKDFKEMMS